MQEGIPIARLGNQLVGKVFIRSLEDLIEIRSGGFLREQKDFQIGINIHANSRLEEMLTGEWRMRDIHRIQHNPDRKLIGIGPVEDRVVSPMQIVFLLVPHQPFGCIIGLFIERSMS